MLCHENQWNAQSLSQKFDVTIEFSYEIFPAPLFVSFWSGAVDVVGGYRNDVSTKIYLYSLQVFYEYSLSMYSAEFKARKECKFISFTGRGLIVEKSIFMCLSGGLRGR